MGRFARDVLNRYAWSGDRTLAGLTIVYRHVGGSGDTRELRGEEVASMDRSFIRTADGTAIPYHRVVRIMRGAMLIFDKQDEREKASRAKRGA